jgi:thiol-disulfide isomerase/thioredoxin
MKKNPVFGLNRSTMLIVAACIAGLIAAVYGIYAIATSNGNPLPAPGASDTAQPAPLPVDGSGGINRAFAQGDLAAFVIHKERKDVADLSFFDETGKERALSEWRGRVVLVNLWATWCAPCRKEMPALADLQSKLGSDDFEVVAISVDRKGAEISAAFLIENRAVALKLYVDPSALVLDKLKAIGLPASYLIDRQGREIGRMFGPAEWNGPDAERLIRTAIAEGGR